LLFHFCIAPCRRSIVGTSVATRFTAVNNTFAAPATKKKDRRHFSVALCQVLGRRLVPMEGTPGLPSKLPAFARAPRRSRLALQLRTAHAVASCSDFLPPVYPHCATLAASYPGRTSGTALSSLSLPRVFPTSALANTPLSLGRTASTSGLITDIGRLSALS
jgi:hypothetical protein